MVLAFNMAWTLCELFWDLDFQPSGTSSGQPVALEASVFGLDFWNSIDHFCFWWLLRFKEIFCGNASHPVVAFLSVVTSCGLCGLL